MSAGCDVAHGANGAGRSARAPIRDTPRGARAAPPSWSSCRGEFEQRPRTSPRRTFRRSVVHSAHADLPAVRSREPAGGEVLQ